VESDKKKPILTLGRTTLPLKSKELNLKLCCCALVLIKKLKTEILKEALRTHISFNINLTVLSDAGFVRRCTYNKKMTKTERQKRNGMTD
jgi:hypothetical protein